MNFSPLPLREGACPRALDPGWGGGGGVANLEHSPCLPAGTPTMYESGSLGRAVVYDGTVTVPPRELHD
jgi:hypothetical protein